MVAKQPTIAKQTSRRAMRCHEHQLDRYKVLGKVTEISFPWKTLL